MQNLSEKEQPEEVVITPEVEAKHEQMKLEEEQASPLKQSNVQDQRQEEDEREEEQLNQEEANKSQVSHEQQTEAVDLNDQKVQKETSKAVFSTLAHIAEEKKPQDKETDDQNFFSKDNQPQDAISILLGINESPPHPAVESKGKPVKKSVKVVQSLQNNKYIKVIFSHFCKENYISSIKSTLFEEKPKAMEEMSLNKWMVFSKEFEIFSKLCSLKIHQRKKSPQETQSINLQNSRTKEQLKVKQMKQVEKILGQIFKKSTENHTKMLFHHFLQAVKLLHQQFKSENEQITQKSDLNFAKTYLYCQSQKQCMHKLANLKFTFGIPQIDYSKVAFTPSQRQKSKSKLNTAETKQNYNQNEFTRKKTKGGLANQSKTMILNPIIKEAKNAMTALDNKASLSTHRKPGSKIKLTLDQSKRWKKNKQQKNEEVNELLAYLDSTKDEILQSYFKGQKMLTAVLKQK